MVQVPHTHCGRGNLRNPLARSRTTTFPRSQRAIKLLYQRSPCRIQLFSVAQRAGRDAAIPKRLPMASSGSYMPSSPRNLLKCGRYTLQVVVEWGPMRDAAPGSAVETMDAPLLPQIAKGSPSSAKGFCSNCGTKRDPDAKFCHGCGERL
mmetsp:Transcript_64157/g.151810  ORF Transcript_64157/g.151810 Transcript_64157/m.151810 type:complete len:150 (+) Transcript_64157:178-627(+)